MIYAPYLIAVSAICCYASLSVIAKKMIPEIPSYTFIGVSMAILSILSFVAGYFFEQKNFSFSSLSYKSWIWIAAFSLINFIGFVLYLMAIKDMPVAHYQTIALISPLIGGLIAFFILQESLSIKFFVGFFIAAIGIYITLKK